jgi:outer membrane protein
MRRVQSGIAVVCVGVMLAPVAGAQDIQYVRDRPGGFLSGFTRQYESKEVLPINLGNSNRLDSLLKAGNIYLSLQDAIALALENNLDIEIQRYDRPQAQASLLRAQAGGPLRGVTSTIQTQTTSALSQVTGGVSTTYASGGTTGSTSTGGTIITATGTSVPSFDPVMSVTGYWSHVTTPQPNAFTTGQTSLVLRNDFYNTGIQQSFSTGTNVSLGFNDSLTRSNALGLYQQFNPYSSGYLSLTVTQSLLQGFGMATNKRYIRVAKNSLRASDLTFKQSVMYTVSQVAGAYWDLVSYRENVKVKEEALRVAQKLYEDNKKQVEIGTLAPIEVVSAEAEVASNQQQLVNAQTQLLQQETGLKNALSKTGVASPSIADAHIIPTDHITVPEVEPVVPVQDLVAQAMQDRPELAESRISIDSSKIQLSGSKSQLLPQLGVYANLQNAGLAGEVNTLGTNAGGGFLPGVGVDPYFIGGTGSLLSQLLARNFPTYTAAVQLTIPFRNRSAQADYVLDTLNLRTQELTYQRLVNQIRVDVRNALIAVQQASASYQAAQKARELQEQKLSAEQKKLALGATTSYQVILFQRDLATAQSNQVSAESLYAKAKVQLDQATGVTLDRYNISLSEAMKGRVSRPPAELPVGQK